MEVQPDSDLAKAKRELEAAAERHRSEDEKAFRSGPLGCCTISASVGGSRSHQISNVEKDECRDIARSNHVQFDWERGPCKS